MGSFIVMSFKFRFYIFRFLCITYKPIRYTQSLFHGIYSSFLSGNLPYFISPFCTLASIIITNFFPDGVSYNGKIKILENNCFYYIQSSMKEIRMIPVKCVDLDY